MLLTKQKEYLKKCVYIMPVMDIIDPVLNIIAKNRKPTNWKRLL